MLAAYLLGSFNDASPDTRMYVAGFVAVLAVSTVGAAVIGLVVLVLFIDGCLLLVKAVLLLIQGIWAAHCRRLEVAEEVKRHEEERAERERQEQREEKRRQQQEAEEAKKPKPPTKEERHAEALLQLNRRIEAAKTITDPVTQAVAIAEANKDYLAALRK